MSAGEAKPESGKDELPDDDTIISVVPDPDMEAAMSEALAPVVARVANGSGSASGHSKPGDGSVIQVSSAGEAKTIEQPKAEADEAETDAADASDTADEPEAAAKTEDEATSDEADAENGASESDKADEAQTVKGADAETDVPESEEVTEPDGNATEEAEAASDADAAPSGPEEAPEAEAAAEAAPVDDEPKSASAQKRWEPAPVVTPPPPAEPVELSAPPEPPIHAAASQPSPLTRSQEPVQSPEYAAMTVPSAGNRIYDHLVEGDDDVIGLITYSLYEKDRRDWLQHWQRQHGSEPTADQYEAFVEAQLTFSQRDRYRSAARQVLDAYASVAVDLEKPVIIRDGIAGRVEEAAKRVEGSGRWWRQLPAALVGGALMAVVLIAIIAILVAAGVDIAGYLGFEQTGG